MRVCINVTCHERRGVSNRKLGCLFGSLFNRIAKKHNGFPLLDLCERKSPVVFPHNGPVMRKHSHAMASPWVEKDPPGR